MDNASFSKYDLALAIFRKKLMILVEYWTFDACLLLWIVIREFILMLK